MVSLASSSSRYSLALSVSAYNLALVAPPPYTDRSVHVVAPMTSSVWKVLVEAGDKVEQGQTLVILEAMKMEIRESGFHVILTRRLSLRPKPDDPVFVPSLLVIVAAIRADETMDGSTVVKVVARPGSLMDPGQTLILLSSGSSE
jgi:hypothetical protein